MPVGAVQGPVLVASAALGGHGAAEGVVGSGGVPAQGTSWGRGKILGNL